MIAKISRGSSPKGLQAYLHGPGKDNEHSWKDQEGREQPGGKVIGGVLGKEGDTSGQGWARQMQRVIDKRPDIDKPIHHISLSAAPSDPVMSSAQWHQIANEYMADMGLQHHPWVLVQHDPNHVHIVVSRVNADGRVWNVRNDRYRSQKATRAIEKRHSLQRVPSRSMGRPGPTQADELNHPVEQALKQRGAPSWRAQIKAVVDSAMGAVTTPEEFRAELNRQGVDVYSNKQGDAVYTIKTKQGQRKITGHKLGADYMEGRLIDGLEQNATRAREVADRELVETYLSPSVEGERAALRRTGVNARDAGEDGDESRTNREIGEREFPDLEPGLEQDQDLYQPDFTEHKQTRRGPRL